MILLKSTHEAILASKDAQIAALKDEVAFLRLFIQPKGNKENIHLTTKANAVLEGRDEPIDVSSPPMTEDEIQTEAALILSGQY